MNRLSHVLLGSFLFLIGCDAESDRTSMSINRDSAGVAIAAHAGGDRHLSVQLQSVWSRGGIDDDDVALVSAEPGHVGLLESGSVAFLDVPNMTVRTLDAASGESRLTWGGRGSGPGELLFPSALAILEGDTVAVFDRGRGRIIRWTSQGELVDEAPVRHFLTGDRLRHVADGFVFNTHRSTIREESLQNLLVVKGDSVRTLRTFTTLPYRTGAYPSCPDYGVASPPLFSPELVWDARDSIIVVADSEDYVIDVLSLHGDIIRQIRRSIDPPALTESLAAERLGEDWFIPQLGCTIPAGEVVRARGFSDRLPVVGGLLLADDGQLWVQRNSLDSPPYVIDIFSADGEYQGTMPAGTPFPAAMSARGAVVAALDAEGVPAITFFRR